MLFSLLSYMVTDYSSGGSIINQHFENGCDSSRTDLGSHNIEQVVRNPVQGKNRMLFTHLTKDSRLLQYIAATLKQSVLQ